MPAATSPSSIKDQLGSERFLRSEMDPPALPESSTALRDDEAIARLAYALWEDRLKNNVSGSAEDDWYRAEQELGS